MVAVEVPKEWDYEADVTVVGGGTAGLPAAIVAAEAGVKTTILETRMICGGSFRMVVGSVAITGTDEQKEQGVEDSTEILYQDMVNICGVEPGIARAFADNQLEPYKMLKEQGIKFPGLYALPGHSRLRGLGYIGKLGPVMVKALEDRAKDRGVEILFKHRGTRLITDPETGRVLGLKVKVGEETKNFKAKRAVILATGGFGRNREMIVEYAPEMVNCIPKMPPSHLGDGLKMGLAMGAATKDIGIAVAPSWPVCIETHQNALRALNFGGIMVNVNGKRFHAESSLEGFYGPMTGVAMAQPGGVYWIVFNDRIKEEIRNTEEQLLNSVEKCKQYKANTIEELAKSAGIDAKGLREIMDKYNSDIDSAGYDTVFGRKFQFGLDRPLLKIDTPTFYSIKCVTSTTSMKGGLKINARAQVANHYDEVIPGLYAAGEVAGGLYTKMYLLGVMTSGSMAFGVIAGRNAAKEPAWQ